MKSSEILETTLVCPFTREPLTFCDDGSAMAAASGRRYPVVNGVPVLRPGPPAEVKDPNHVSNTLSDEYRDLMLACEGPVLFLGAGASTFQAGHIIEAEYNIFKNTDVAADAHCLPFRDEQFKLVVAMNVFEHLREPHVAAEEVRRVLRPGGEVIIHTAFLQPLHEEPHHYYGATEFGVRQWFMRFASADVRVTPNFHPYVGLSWLASNLIGHATRALGPDAGNALEAVTLGDLATYWRERRNAPGARWDVFSQLPADVQARFAAGFQCRAVK